MPTVGAAGTRFYYEELGSGPPLVLVHGTGGNTSMLAPAARLLATSHRVITYDRRGFTRTNGQPPRRHDYLRVHADDLTAVMRELGAVPATVVGWSWGAIVALAAAVHHADMVEALVLFEPPFQVKKHPSLSLMRAIGGALALGKVGAHRRGAERFARWVLRRKDGKSGYDEVDTATRGALLDDARTVIAELEAGTGEELTDAELARVKCPVSLVAAEQTRAELAGAVTRLGKTFPAARTVSIRDADHMAIVKRPDAFAAAVSDALA